MSYKQDKALDDLTLTLSLPHGEYCYPLPIIFINLSIYKLLFDIKKISKQLRSCGSGFYDFFIACIKCALILPCVHYECGQTVHTTAKFSYSRTNAARLFLKNYKLRNHLYVK